MTEGSPQGFRTPGWRIALLLLLVTSALTRSDLWFRTAFVDEAIYLHGGWQLLHGEPTSAERYYMGWYPLVQLPIGLAGHAAGLAGARGLSVAWSVLTTLVVALLGARLHGPMAGIVAGALFAVHAPSIAIGTLATYDSQSLSFLLLGLLLFARALDERRAGDAFAAGGAMLVAVLTRYAAILAVGAVGAVVVGAAAAALAARRASKEPEHAGPRLPSGTLVAALLPLALLAPFAWHYGDALRSVFAIQVLTKADGGSGVRAQVLLRLARMTGAALLLAVAGIVRGSRHRLADASLVAIALTFVAYHLANRDLGTLYKHASIVLAVIATLVGGGAVAIGGIVAASRPGRKIGVGSAVAAAVAGLLAVAQLALHARGELPELRRYWSDTTELMGYLRPHAAGKRILMEGGFIASYELMDRAAPGRGAAAVDTTWLPEEQLTARLGTGSYDWVVLDDTLTPELNVRLRAAMEDRYELDRELDARRREPRKIRVYRRRIRSD